MSDKLVLIRTRVVALVLSHLFTHVEEIAQRLEGLLAPHVPQGEQLPSMSVLLRTLGRLIRSRLEDLVSFKKAHRDELDNDLETRQRRDAAFTGLYGKMVETRRLADAAYGKARAKELIAVDGPTASVPDELLDQAQHTQERLRRPPEEQPPAVVEGISPDPGKWADDLEPFVTTLDEALQGVSRDRSMAADTVEAKSRAMKELNFVFIHGLAVLRGFFFLAGRPDLGKRLPSLYRVRKSRRGPNPREELPAGPEQPAAEEPPSTEEPPAEEPPL
ncbi:MAG TPA: hypothetical protein VGG06_19620 [Thermoanaerobaculia bacterium]